MLFRWVKVIVVGNIIGNGIHVCPVLNVGKKHLYFTTTFSLRQAILDTENVIVVSIGKKQLKEHVTMEMPFRWVEKLVRIMWQKIGVQGMA